MAQSAAHLVDNVIPRVPVRQWVLSLPIPLRLLLAAQPVLVTPVLQVVHRVITRHQLDQTGFKADEADSGAVTLIQRFGSAANLNIHLHCLVLDGVYRRTDGGPVFVQADSPTDEELQALLHKIITRLMKLLTRRGVLVKEEEGGPSYLADADADADSDEARALRPLQAAACTYRIAFGPRAGQKVFTVQGAMARDAGLTQALCADHQGNSAARGGALRRRRASGWNSCAATLPDQHWPMNGCRSTAPGRSCSSSRPAWRDGTTHIVMSPLEFMQRLAALVPRPRLHLIRFHGVLAPNAKLRALVVPRAPEQATGESAVPVTESGCTHGLPARIGWARLLKRVFQIDLAHCPNCGGQLKIIAAILEARVIERILTHLGLQARAPPGCRRAEIFSRRSDEGGPALRAAGEGLRLARAEPGEGLSSVRVCPMSRQF